MALDIANGIELPILQALGHAVRARLRYLRRDPLEVIDQEAPEALQATALDLGLHTEVRAVALWAQARRGPLELGAIQPMLDGLTDRLTQVATCSTLVAQVLIDVLRLSGHLAEARKLTDEIIAFAVARNESVYLPELLRLRANKLRLRTLLRRRGTTVRPSSSPVRREPKPGATCKRQPRCSRGSSPNATPLTELPLEQLELPNRG